jgi:Yip1 domain
MAAPEPQATTAVAYTPVVTDALRLVRALFSPRAVFEEQQDKPTFWMPWVVVSIAFAIVQFLQRPFQTRVRELVYQQLNRPMPAGGGGPVSMAIGVATGAATVLIMAALAAGIFYLLLSVFGGDTSFKKMLTVSIFGWPIAILGQLLTFIVLTMRGVGSINSVWDMFVSFGADVLLPADLQLSAFQRLFLAGIGPLAIWQVVITAIGLRVLGKVSKGGAWATAIITFIILLAVTAFLGAFGMKAAGG